MADATLRAEALRYKVHLERFEGPLDLLLHLVKKHELNIFDIPIAFIAQEYLKYLDMMRELNLDVASEYLLMAATLAHIKSREMLPRPSDEEEAAAEGTDPKAELTKRLVEYQRYKAAAEVLANRPLLGDQVWTRPKPARPPEPETDGLRFEPLGIVALIQAFARLVENLESEVTHEVLVERVSISARITEVLDMLRGRGKLTLSRCLANILAGGRASPSVVRSELVVTFLALLELARLRMVRLFQGREDGEIYVQSTEESEDGRMAPAADEL